MIEAYCGPAPTPASLFWAWNPDPVALGLCVVLGALHMHVTRKGRLPLWTAVGLIFLLFVSPLCALTTALFSARVAHHILLVAVAAPLLALAFADRELEVRIPLSWLAGLHAATVWFWHVPDIYSAAIYSAVLYWLMQASLLGTGVLLWRGIFAERANIGAAMLALLATVIQMGMLGALLTFAQKPLYQPHFLTTGPFGLSPLEDQQLAGLIMWVPAALPYLLAALLLFAARLTPRRLETVAR
jgi:putative membrane protein